MRSNRINHNMVLTKDCTLHHVQLYILQNIITIVSYCLFLSVPNLITGMGGFTGFGTICALDIYWRSWSTPTDKGGRGERVLRAFCVLKTNEKRCLRITFSAWSREIIKLQKEHTIGTHANAQYQQRAQWVLSVHEALGLILTPTNKLKLCKIIQKANYFLVLSSTKA